MERSLQIMQPLKRLPWLLAQPKMTLFPSCKFYSWTCFGERNDHQVRGREGTEEGIVWKVKQDSERCGKTTDQPSVSPYSFSFSPAGEASSPPASWLLPPPGAADTCGNSPLPPPQTCWEQRRPQSAGRRWSRGASRGCSSWLAAKWKRQMSAEPQKTQKKEQIDTAATSTKPMSAPLRQLSGLCSSCKLEPSGTL